MLMQSDDLREQISRLEQERNAIMAERAMAQRPSVQEVLDKELATIDAQITTLNQQITVTIGDNNNFAQSNIAIGNQGTITQHLMHFGGTNASSATFGDNVMVAGGDIHSGDTILNIFFADKPPTDGKKLLDDYLKTMIIQHYEVVRLQRLTTKPQNGNDTNTIPKHFSSTTTYLYL
jgi:hypothetical protein